MSDTTFVNGVTLTDADWFNDLNRLHYTILGDPANLAAVKTTVVTAAAGGSLVLLQTATASASATVDLTTGITSTYDEYLIVYSDVVPGTDNTDLYLRVSQDGGSTFKSGASDYRWGRYAWTDGAATAASGSTGATHYMVMLGLGNATGETCSGEVRILRPSTSSGYKQITAYGSLFNASIQANATSGALVLNESAINGFRLIMSSGTITRGEFALYGVRKA